MSEEPFPLVEISEDLHVRQVRAVWYSSADKQTHIRVDDRLTIVVAGNEVEAITAKWREATR